MWKNYKNFGIIALLAVHLTSCNKDLDNKLDFDQNPSDLQIQANQYKIAYIVVEGAVGTVVGNEATDYGNMPNLAAMTLNSTFSWNSVSNENGLLTSNYADLLTGTEITKHQVINEQATGNNLANYPTLFKRIKQYTDARTALVSNSDAVQRLVETGSLDLNKQVASDEEVVVHAKEELKREEVGVLVATFSDVQKAGRQFGFGPKVAGYVQALHTFDQRLGDLMTTIKARPGYKNEKWLVAVVSSNGGDYTLDPALQDGSIYAIPARNNFALMYNSDFTYKLVERMETADPSWISSAATYVSNGTAANQVYGKMSASDSKLYDIDKSKEYTIQLKVKFLQFGGYNTTLLGNRSSTSGGEAGWAFLNGYSSTNDESSANIRLKVAGTTAYFTQKLELNSWYTLTGRFFQQEGKQFMTIYVDGVAGETKDISGVSGIGSGVFQLGYGSGFIKDTQKHMIGDVRFYNTALPVAQIQSNYCTTMSTALSDAYYPNLIGYWPANDEAAVIRDQSPSRRNFTMVGPFAFTSFSERAGNLCPTLPDYLERYVIRSVDIPKMVYNWLGIIEVGQFNLDAQSWAPAFSNQ